MSINICICKQKRGDENARRENGLHVSRHETADHESARHETLDLEFKCEKSPLLNTMLDQEWS